MNRFQERNKIVPVINNYTSFHLLFFCPNIWCNHLSYPALSCAIIIARAYHHPQKAAFQPSLSFCSMIIIFVFLVKRGERKKEKERKRSKMCASEFDESTKKEEEWKRRWIQPSASFDACRVLVHLLPLLLPLHPLLLLTLQQQTRDERERERENFNWFPSSSHSRLFSSSNLIRLHYLLLRLFIRCLLFLLLLFLFFLFPVQSTILIRWNQSWIRMF